MEYIAVQGCTLEVTTTIIEGTTQIISLPSIKCKAKDKGIYRDTVTVSLSAYSDGTYNQVGTATGNFIITSTKCKADNQFVLRYNDSTAPITINLQNTVTPFDSKTATATVRISDAGQDKVKGN